jgi:hypothetical protein
MLNRKTHKIQIRFDVNSTNYLCRNATKRFKNCRSNLYIQRKIAHRYYETYLVEIGEQQVYRFCEILTRSSKAGNRLSPHRDKASRYLYTRTSGTCGRTCIYRAERALGLR